MELQGRKIIDDSMRPVSFPIISWSFILISIAVYYLVENLPVVDSATLGFATAYTLFTSSFVYIGFDSLVASMMILLMLADNVEDNLGMFNFIMFFFICGFLGAILEIFLTGEAAVAPYAITGIVGAYCRLFPHSELTLKGGRWFSMPVKVNTGSVLIIWALFQMLHAWMGFATISDGAFYIVGNLISFWAGFFLIAYIYVGREVRGVQSE